MITDGFSLVFCARSCDGASRSAPTARDRVLGLGRRTFWLRPSACRAVDMAFPTEGETFGGGATSFSRSSLAIR